MFFKPKKTFIIAEIGSNHNKCKKTLKELIDAASYADVDAIKFQTVFPGDIASSLVPANAYGDFDFVKGKNTWNEVLDNLVLPREWHEWAFQYACSKGLLAFSTPESVEAVDFLESLDVPMYKIASMDLNYKKLICHVAKMDKPVIFSTGMAELSEIARTHEWLKFNGVPEIGILHCVSKYPPQYDEINLNRIKMFMKMFPDATVGFSDHSLGIATSVASVALGAKIIEKHITLDRNMDGPDHPFSLEPIEFKNLVKAIRRVEAALLPVEYSADFTNRKKYRRSLAYSQKLPKGHKLSFEDLDCKRPGNGIEPELLDFVVGLTLKRTVEFGEMLKMEDLY